MLDCHAHLACNDFFEDLPLVIEQSKKDGVQGCIVVPEFVTEFNRVLELASSYRGFLFPCLGLHPVQGIEKSLERRSVTIEEFEMARPLILQHADNLVGIGEVGLDFTPYYCRDDGNKETQRAVLTGFVELSKTLNLPLNVHSRSAGRPTIELLKANGASAVLMHAFDGNPRVAMQGAAAGYYFSIPPSVVRDEQKRRLIEKLPLERLLLETDSPALGPESQVRNVPSNLSFACEYIAKIKGVDTKTVVEVTTENALKLFPKVKKFVKSL